jgi:hypothetical protein
LVAGGGGNGKQVTSFTRGCTQLYTAVLHAPRSARTEAESSSLHGVQMLLLNIFTSLRAQEGGEGGKAGERPQQTNVHYASGGRGEPAQSGQRATRVSNTRRFTKSHRRRASEDRRK